MRASRFRGFRPALHWAIACPALFSLTTAHALAAADFRARGNEPGWSITINDNAIELRTMEGRIARVSPILPAQRVGETETYSGQADGQPFAIVITSAVCNDTMSGMPHPKAVSFTWGDMAVSGCGGEPSSLLQGEWKILSVNGRAASEKAELKLEDNGSLSGGGICNRFFGGFELSGEALTFGAIGSTQMACEQNLMEEEALLLKSLGEVNGFGVGSDGTLTLKGAATAIVARRR